MTATIALDDFDLRLLAALQEEGRLTNQDLAERVGLSASQCSRRRQRLEEAEVIRGYSARLSAEAVGLDVVAFIQVQLATHSGDNARRFRDLLDRMEEVQEAFAVTGDSDYLLKVVVADLKGLSAIVNEVLLPHGAVQHVRSSIALDRLKETNRLPLTDRRRPR